MVTCYINLCIVHFKDPQILNSNDDSKWFTLQTVLGKIILVLVRENGPKRFSHPAYSCSHSVLFTLLTTPRKAEEPSDINERCTASPLCQRPRFCCCCLFSAMNLEELQNSICNNVFLSNGWMLLVGVANCYNTKTQLLTAQKNVQFKSSPAVCK